MKIRNILVALLLGASSCGVSAQTSDVSFLSGSHCIVRMAEGSRYIMLPVQENAEICNIKVIAGNNLVRTIEVRLAVDNVDYYVPFDLSEYDGKKVLLDIHVNSNSRLTGGIKDHVCWRDMKYTDTVEINAGEPFRPVYHHTPEWGWMNDPNGMFYKDGVWHLYYQLNPYGSQWGNISWGHSTSKDLVNWTNEGVALVPDGHGMVFSGSSVVDKDNTAGFGKDAIVAFYTSAAESQTQSMAYSTDDGKTFTRYEGNPIIVADIPDFRDPHVFRHEQTGRWIMILAAGQEMRIYSSSNLKDWTYESSFGKEYGSHAGVWECPDLFELPVEGTNEKKWVLVCNINPGGPFGGSATQYFTGTFDGHKFTCDTTPEVTKWMDYGKDHYAAVSFDNAPDGRRVMIAWMSNWQYANQVPTVQFRSANAIARDVYLFRDKGVDYVGSRPVAEMTAMRGDAVVSKKATLGRLSVKNMFKAPSGAYEIDLAMAPQDGATVKMMLSNQKGEYVTIVYDGNMGTLSFDRRQGGDKSFSELFPAVTTAPVHGKLTSLRIFVDKSSVEVFGNDGRAVMTNLVFPAEPYNTLTINSDKKTAVSSLKVYPLIKK